MPSVVAVDLVARKISVSPSAGEAELYQDIRDDTLYGVVGTTVVPLLSGDLATGVYRTGVVVMDNHPHFAWLRLEGPVTAAVVRIYGDGVLRFTSGTISGGVPVRVPAFRAREWEVEVESDDRVTDVTLAGSTAELL